MIIEAEIIKYLSDIMDVPVCAETPEKMPEEYVTVNLIAGGMENHIPAATVSIVSHSVSKLEAAVLDEMVREKMLEIIELETVSSCKLGGMSNNNDTATKKYRYESIFNLIYY